MARTGWSKQQNFIFHSSGGWKSKIKVRAEMVFPKASFLCLQRAAFSWCPRLAFVCVHVSLVTLFLLIKTSVILDQDAILRPYFIVITSLKTLSPNTVGSEGFGMPTYTF